MLQTLTSTALVAGTFLMALASEVASARDHGREGRHDSGRSERGDRGGRGFSGGHYSGRQSFVSPRRFDGGRGYGYAAPRSYGRPLYRSYRGGAYFGYSAPYGYAYAPGYAYPAPVPQQQACVEGSYDRYGVPNSNCYPAQQQYQQQYQEPQQNYSYDQQQYGPPQQEYDQNQEQYPQQQQNYDRNQPGPYDR